MRGQKAVEFDALPAQRLPAAEGEQLPGELAGLPNSGDDRIKRRLAIAGLGARNQGKAGVATDHLEQIVEVVRDATGEQTHGFELLRFP